jgi:hypothetical protein
MTKQLKTVADREKADTFIANSDNSLNPKIIYHPIRHFPV